MACDVNPSPVPLAVRLRRLGIDARLALFIPLSTVFAVGLATLLLTLPFAITNPDSTPASFQFIGGLGLISAVLAWPVTLPLSLAAWVAAHWAHHRRGDITMRGTMAAAGLAGLAGAAGFAALVTLNSAPEAGLGLFALVLIAVVPAALAAARLIYGRRPA